MEEYPVKVNALTNEKYLFFLRVNKTISIVLSLLIIVNLFIENLILVLINSLLLILNISFLKWKESYYSKSLIITNTSLRIKYFTSKFNNYSETYFWKDIKEVIFNYNAITIYYNRNKVIIYQVDFPNDFYLIKDAIRKIKKRCYYE